MCSFYIYISKCTSICTSIYLHEHRNCKDFVVCFIHSIIGEEYTTSLPLSTLTVRTFPSLGTNQLFSLLKKALQDSLLKVPCGPERNLWASRDHCKLFGAIHLSSKLADTPASAKISVEPVCRQCTQFPLPRRNWTQKLFLDNFAQRLCCLTSLCPKYLTQVF